MIEMLTWPISACTQVTNEFVVGLYGHFCYSLELCIIFIRYYQANHIVHNILR